MFHKSLLVMACGLCLAASLNSQAVKVVIVHDNDTHSQLYPFGPQDTWGGLARRATLIKELRRQNKNVLVLNAGDVFVGSTGFNKFFGYPELKLMDELYDVMALGNHEFDLGLDMLTSCLSGSIAGGSPVQMSILCANIDLTSQPNLDPMVSPSVIKNVGGVRIGIFALITTDAEHYSAAVHGLLQDPLTVAAATASSLKKAGCDAVICLSHSGYLVDRYYLSAISDIDVIIGGHSHDLVPAETDNGTIVVQAGEAGLHLGELTLAIDPGKTPKVSLVRHDLHKIDATIHKDPVVLQTLNGLRAAIVRDPRFGPMLTKRIGRADWLHSKTWTATSPYRDTALGNLVMDGVKRAVEIKNFPVDCALGANGYLGHHLYAGKVTGDDLLRCLPYGFDPASGRGFKIKVVQLYGLQLMAGLEYSVSQVEYTRDLCLEVSGLEFKYDSSKPATQRVDYSSIKIAGAPINPYGLYWVALNEQLAAFLKTLGMIPNDEKQTGILEYFAVSDYIGELGHLRYRSTGRVQDTH